MANKRPKPEEIVKNTLGRVTLLTRSVFIFIQPVFNLIRIAIQLWPLDYRGPSVPRRFRIRQHPRNAVSTDPKIPSDTTPTQPILKMGAAQLQIQLRRENPQALPSNERAKVVHFYAARDNTMSPLPWPSIAPPITQQNEVAIQIAALNRTIQAAKPTTIKVS